MYNNLTTTELINMNMEDLQKIALDLTKQKISKMKRTELIALIKEEIIYNEQYETKRVGAKKKRINVYKDGKLIKTIDGLMETFKWVTENNITNVGWVKRSLKTGEETKAGYKYKEGGYKFEYAD